MWISWNQRLTNEHVFVLTNERLFAAHMFAKHSFGVNRNGWSPIPESSATNEPPDRLSHPVHTEHHDRSFRPRPRRPPSALAPSARLIGVVWCAGTRSRGAARRGCRPVRNRPSLPVVHRDEVYRRRRLVVAAIVLALVLGAGSLFASRDAAPSAVDAASGRSRWWCSRATPSGESPRPRSIR